MFRMRHLLPCLSIALLLTACSSREDTYDSVSFTEEDAARVSEILDKLESGQSGAPTNLAAGPASGSAAAVIDVSGAERFSALRSGIGALPEDTFRVTNVFLNVRKTPAVQGEKVEELKKGDRVKLLDFPNAAWAHVELPDRRQGYVNVSYIAAMATEKTLPQLKKKYDGLFYVDFAFLNVRAAPETSAQKIGELLSNQIVRPVSLQGEWARVPYDGKEGFVSTQYLKPFTPNVVVRQESFALPVLRYRGDEQGVVETLVKHLAFLKAAGRKMMTLRAFYDLLLQQEEKDVRLPPNAVLLSFSDLTPESLKDIGDALRATGVTATFFLETNKIGPQGISSQVVKTLAANGNDMESAGHEGNDLRSLTNSQVALDFRQSRQALQGLTGRDVLAIAYPGGGVNDRIAEEAMKAGYLFGLTLEPAAGGIFDRSQFLRLPSILVSPSTTEQTLKTLIGIL